MCQGEEASNGRLQNHPISRIVEKAPPDINQSLNGFHASKREVEVLNLVSNTRTIKTAVPDLMLAQFKNTTVYIQAW